MVTDIVDIIVVIVDVEIAKLVTGHRHVRLMVVGHHGCAATSSRESFQVSVDGQEICAWARS